MNKTAKILTITGAILATAGITTLGVLLIKKYAKKANIGKGGKNLLFVGDSLTAAKESYADLFATVTQNNYKKIAVVGISTGDMLTNLKNELKNNKKYDYIFILGGYNNNYAYGNDDGSNVDFKFDKTKKELQEMFNIAKEKGSKVVAITPPSSANHQKYNSYRQEFHDKLNKWILKSDADYKIDLYSLEVGSNNKPKAGMTIADGQHLSREAHKILAQEITRKLM
jgi:hypothetical protein